MPDPKRGEVWIVDLGRPSGSEPAKVRPVIILQNNALSGLQTRLVVVLTTNLKRADYRGNLLLSRGTGGLPEDSVVLGHQIMALDKRKFQRRLGLLDEAVLSEIERRILYCLGIPTE